MNHRQSPFEGFFQGLQIITKNRSAFIGLVLISFLVLISIFAPLIAIHSPIETFEGALRLGPWSYFQDKGLFILGTDDLGRDLFSRIVYGGRVSLWVGFSISAITSFFGSSIGLIGGYFGGWTDRILMRLMDLILAMPSILLAIVVVAVLGPGITNAIIALSVVSLPVFARLVRSQVMIEKNKAYVEASRLFGSSHLRTMFVEILPNCTSIIVVQASFCFGEAILVCAALGFLGLGAQAPIPEWGAMLSDSKVFLLSNPLLMIIPGLAIMTSVLSFNWLGDGIRDALDPKHNRGQS